MLYQKRFRLLPIILILVILTTMFGCKEIEPIKIGVLSTMSGAYSELGVSGRRGVEIAIAEINNEGGINGRRLEVVYKDQQNDMNLTSYLVEEFKDEGIDIIVGPYTSASMLEIIDFLNTNEMLSLSPTVSMESLSGNNDYMIRFIANTEAQVEAIVGRIVENGHNKFTIIKDMSNLAFTQSIEDSFNQKSDEVGLIVKNTIEFENGASLNIQELVNQISKDTDSLLVIANSKVIADIAQEIKIQDRKLNIYTTLWGTTQELISNGGDAVEGVYVARAIDNKGEAIELLQFLERFKERYGVDATFASLYSYEAVFTLKEAIERENLKSVTAKTVKEAIINVSVFKGLQDTYIIDEYGDNKRKYYMYVIKNGQFVNIED